MDLRIYNCGVATGFPPYQYKNKQGQIAGMDVEITRMVFKTAGLNVKYVQNDWEELLFLLYHNTKVVDMLCGAEFGSEREKYLDFTVPFYKRRTVLFILKESSINKIADLYGKIVTGDLHSSFEKALGDKKRLIRITKTVSKEESFIKLRDKKVVAVIAPIEVGIYLSRELKIPVRIIDENYPGTPVSIAVKKGNKLLLDNLNISLRKLISNGEVEKIIKKYSQ